MSRGFDGPEIDDFQNPVRDVNRSPESNSRAGWTPSGGWKEFAVRRNGLTSVTRKPAEPLAATARPYLAWSGSSWSSREPAARTTWIVTGPTNFAIPSCTP